MLVMLDCPLMPHDILYEQVVHQYFGLVMLIICL